MDNRILRFSNISPVCLIRTLVRNIWMIAAAAMIFYMGTSLYLSWVHKPVYQATMTYAAMAKRTSYTSSANISASEEVTSLMTELLMTREIHERIAGSSEELADFDGTISAAQVGKTNLITVSVTDGSPRTAFLAIQALAEFFPELSGYASNSTVMEVIRNPMVSSVPINGLNRSSLTTRAGIVGALLMAAVLCWISVSRETIQTREGARQLLDAPILAVVDHERKNRTLKAMLRNTNKGLQVFAPTTSFSYTEQINTICTRLEQENANRGLKVFMVTGVGENEGKSTIAANVASMLAMKGKNVALVDGDLRKPAMTRLFDGVYKSELPLNKMLAQPFARNNFLKCMVRHPRLGLYMFFASGPESKTAQLLSGQTMQTTIRQLRVFDYVIIDTPPMGFFTDAEALAQYVDGTLLVVRQDSTPACDLNDAADMLRSAGSSFLGCVLNDMWGHGLGGGTYGYGYGYGARKSDSRKN